MKMVTVFLSIMLGLILVGVTSSSIVLAGSLDKQILRLKREINDLKKQAIAEYDRNPGSNRFDQLNRQIKEKKAKLAELHRKKSAKPYDPDLDGNGCIDAGEANEYELIAGRRYTGPKPLCGPDRPSW